MKNHISNVKRKDKIPINFNEFQKVSNRRTNFRDKFIIPLSIKMEGLRHTGVCEDFSHGGLSVILKRKLTGSPDYCFRFFQSDLFSLDIPGKIVYQMRKATEENEYKVGIKFDEKTSVLEKEVLCAYLYGEESLRKDMELLIIPVEERTPPSLHFTSEQWSRYISYGPAYLREGPRRKSDRREISNNKIINRDKRKTSRRKSFDRRSVEPIYKLTNYWMHSVLGVLALTIRDFLLHLLPSRFARLLVPNVSFVFMAHFRDLEDVPKKFSFARFLPKKFLEGWLLKQWPVIGSYITGFKLKNGTIVRGAFVLVPMTGKQIMQHPQLAKLRVTQAAKLSEKIGAKIIGLGAFTSIATNDGISLEKYLKDASLTTGTAFSAAIAVQNLYKASQLMGLEVQNAKVAIVGAAGAVGSACAEVLSSLVKSLILVDINIEKLDKVVRHIQIGDAKCSLDSHKNLDSVKEADVIIVVTNSPGIIIRSRHVKTGAIVIDCAQPRNVSNHLSVERSDVLVVESAVIKTSSIETNIDMGLANSEVFGCLAETMILTWLGWKGHFSLGKVSAFEVNALNLISRQIGFSLAHLRNANGYVDEKSFGEMKNIIGI